MKELIDPILTKDPERFYEGVNPSWPAFGHSRLLIAGGAGFLCRWSLCSFKSICDTCGMKMQVVALTRDPEFFRVSEPERRKHHGRQ